jgi:CHASE3 domain sensor protein
MKVGTKLFLMSVGTAIIILVVGITSMVSLSSLIESIHQVSHSRDVLQELHLLMFNLSDCISAQRGYIISGQKPFLEAYDVQVTATDDSVNKIEKLVKDNPEQSARVDDLRTTVKDRLLSLQTTCDLYKEKGSEAAFERIRNGKSLQFRVLLHKKIEAMMNTELVLLEEREHQAKRNAVSAELTVFAGMALALAFVGVSNFLFGSTILGCVKQLITASENIKYGRFDLSASTSSNDEFADLASAFNSMGQQLLISSRNLKEKKSVVEAHEQTISHLQSQASSLETKLGSVSNISENERHELESHKQQIAELETWLATLTDMSNKFQDLDRTNQNYVQRMTIANEGASKLTASLQTDLDFRHDVDQMTLSQNFNARLDKLNDLNQSIEKLIASVELVTLSAEMEAARSDKPDKALEVFITSLKNKTAEAKSARADVQKYLNELKNSTTEVLERYRDVASKLTGSRRNADRIAQELDKQTELCHELRILFSDATMQKYINLINGKKAFTHELKKDVENRGMRAEQLSDIINGVAHTNG